MHWHRIITACLIASLVGASAPALTISNSYSPLSRKRPPRQSTRYIILHTTEAPLASSLKSVRKYGECHYLVAPNGHVYRVVDRKRVAFHAGRSMWSGQTNIDKYSLGIEIVGYHNRPITSAQYAAVGELLQDLQRIYSIPDDRVLTHSMVAYGAPNRWHRRSHRGRKRCGMLFATWTVRERLGLTRQPKFDPDIKAGRLAIGDPYLAKVLYGTASEQDRAVVRFTGADATTIAAGRSAWDIARDKYNTADVIYTFPNGTRKRGSEITDWKAIPAGTRVSLGGNQCENVTEGIREIGRDGSTALAIAGDEFDDKTTIYILPNGSVKKGDQFASTDFNALPKKTRMLVGYVDGGCISATRSAFDVCGPLWNHADTFYRFPDGSLRSGNTVNEKAIPAQCMVFFKN